MGTAQLSLDFEAADRSRETARSAIRRLSVSENGRRFLLALFDLGNAAPVSCSIRRVSSAAGMTESAGRAAVIELAYGCPAFLHLKIDPGRANEYRINWAAVFAV